METTYHDNYASKLQRLLHTVVKNHKKFSKAQDQTESAEFRDFFQRVITERAAIITELKDALRKLGSQPNDDIDEFADHQHHHSGTAKKDQSILESIRSSEQETLDTYDDVLQGSILEDFDLKTMIMGQRLKINESYTELDRRYFELFKLSQPY